MRWLYRIQTQVGIAGPEGAAALAILSALAFGLTAWSLQAASEPVPPDFYAASDAAFAEAAAAAPTDSSTTTGAASLVAEAPGASADSTAAEVAEAEVKAAAAPRRTGELPPVPTNINTASEAELQRLPRIGPALAARIVEHRRVHGPFQRPEQITDVKGIGERTFEKLAPWIHI